MNKSHIDIEKLYEKALKISRNYGFMSFHEINEKKGSPAKRVSVNKEKIDEKLNKLSKILKFYLSQSLDTQENPLLVFHSNIDKDNKSAFTTSKKPEETQITLTAVGIENSFAEALVMSCISNIFDSLKEKNMKIRINSIGTEKDSKQYFDTLQKTLRKIKTNISPECKKILDKSQIVEAHPLLFDESHKGVYENLIPSVRLLSESARLHFQEIIEFLEEQNLSYELASDLVELPTSAEHSIIEIQGEDTSLYARGARYDTFSKKVFNKKIPVVSVTITTSEKTMGTHKSQKTGRRPKIFLLHSGKIARLKSLPLLQKLTDNNIKVCHGLYHQRVLSQIENMEKEYLYTIIFGQEEAENNVLRIRNNETNSYKILNIEKIDQLKKIL